MSIHNSPQRTINILVSEMLTQWNTRLEQKHFKEILKSISPELVDIRVNVFSGNKDTELSRIDAGERVSMYDIYIWHYDAVTMPGQVHSYERYRKSAQAEMINAAAKRVGAKQHEPIPTWTIKGVLGRSNGTSNVNVPYVPQGTYVIRPEDGARSVGQLIVDTTKCDIHHVLNDFDESWFTKDHKHIPGVLPIPGHINHEGEAASQLKDGFFIQKKVDHLDQEFRVVTGIHGDIEYIFKRMRQATNGNDMEYAHVSAERDVLVYNRLAGNPIDMALKALCLSSNAYHEFEATLRELDLKCNSVDLFIRRQGSFTSWGIFEFCNQFSISDWKSDDAIALTANWYTHVLERYLSKVVA